MAHLAFITPLTHCDTEVPKYILKYHIAYIVQYILHTVGNGSSTAFLHKVTMFFNCFSA